MVQHGHTILQNSHGNVIIQTHLNQKFVDDRLETEKVQPVAKSLGVFLIESNRETLPSTSVESSKLSKHITESIENTVKELRKFGACPKFVSSLIKELMNLFRMVSQRSLILFGGSLTKPEIDNIESDHLVGISGRDLPEFEKSTVNPETSSTNDKLLIGARFSKLTTSEASSGPSTTEDSTTLKYIITTESYLQSTVENSEKLNDQTDDESAKKSNVFYISLNSNEDFQSSTTKRDLGLSFDVENNVQSTEASPDTTTFKIPPTVSNDKKSTDIPENTSSTDATSVDAKLSKIFELTKETTTYTNNLYSNEINDITTESSLIPTRMQNSEDDVSTNNEEILSTTTEKLFQSTENSDQTTHTVSYNESMFAHNPFTNFNAEISTDEPLIEDTSKALKQVSIDADVTEVQLIDTTTQNFIDLDTTTNKDIESENYTMSTTMIEVSEEFNSSTNSEDLIPSTSGNIFETTQNSDQMDSSITTESTFAIRELPTDFRNVSRDSSTELPTTTEMGISIVDDISFDKKSVLDYPDPTTPEATTVSSTETTLIDIEKSISRSDDKNKPSDMEQVTEKITTVESNEHIVNTTPLASLADENVPTSMKQADSVITETQESTTNIRPPDNEEKLDESTSSSILSLTTTEIIENSTLKDKLVEYYDVYEYYDLNNPDEVIFEIKPVNGTTEIVHVTPSTTLTEKIKV